MTRRLTRYAATVLAAFSVGGTMQAAMAQDAWIAPIEYCEPASPFAATPQGADCTANPTYFDWPHTLMRATPDGGVVSAARYGESPIERTGGVVVKRDAVTGRERWRYVRVGNGFDTDFFRDLALLDDGDIALVSYPELATRLDGATGQVRWSAPRPAGFAWTSVVAGAGNDVAVLTAGEPRPDPDYTSPIVIFKLAGADGHELWRSTQPGVYRPVMQRYHVRPLANGDVIANATWSTFAAQEHHYYVVRLRGSDGAQQWRVEFDQAAPGGVVTDLSLTAGGDVVVVGLLDGQGWAMRLRGADGAVLWSKTFAAYSQLNRGVVWPNGDVMLVGIATTWRFTRVSGVDGTTQWSRELPANGAAGSVWTLARAPDDTMLASGHCTDHQTLCLVGLDAATGADRWSFTRTLVHTGMPVYARDLVFDARGNLLVNAPGQSRTVPGNVTAAQWRIVGPWADDLFANGFD